MRNRLIVLATVVGLAIAATAQAGHHLWDFTEIYSNASGTIQYIELFNRSAAYSFDLSGWRLDGPNFTFPLGSILTNGQTIVLARNRRPFNTVYPGVPVFGEFGANLSALEQIIAMVDPDPAGDRLIDAIRYEAIAPWPPDRIVV
jgi:hypothetical protein